MMTLISRGLEADELKSLFANASAAYIDRLDENRKKYEPVVIDGEEYVPIGEAEPDDGYVDRLALKNEEPEFLRDPMSGEYDWPSDEAGDEIFGWVPCYTLTWSEENLTKTPDYSTVELFYNVFTKEIEFF